MKMFLIVMITMLLCGFTTAQDSSFVPAPAYYGQSSKTQTESGWWIGSNVYVMNFPASTHLFTKNYSVTETTDTLSLGHTPKFVSFASSCMYGDTIYVSPNGAFPDSATVVLNGGFNLYNSNLTDRTWYIKSNSTAGIKISISSEGK